VRALGASAVPALAGAFIASPPGLAAQEIHAPLSPAGRLRLQVAPAFLSWDSRFGERSEDGGLVEEVEPLGLDLTDESGRRLFPRVADLEASLRALLADPAFEATLGRSRARVTASQVRVPVRLDLGLTEWLTLGVTVPLVRSRTEIAVSFDTLSANLGVNPMMLRPGEVESFTGNLEVSGAAVRARADELCGADPSSVECEQAGALAGEADALLQGFLAGYGASPFFPVGTSAAADLLIARVALYSEGLESLGLAPLTRSPVFAEGPLGQEALDQLLSLPGAGLNSPTLRDRVGLWELGDVEVHAALRLLEGGGSAPLDSLEGGGGGFRYLLGAGLLVRLPTGAQDDPDIFLDLPAGDGQTDLEGRLFANVQGGRFGFWGDARYGIQQPVTVTRRIAPPDIVLVPAVNRATVEWTPGSYLQLELVPRFHFTDELAFTLGYRFFGKGEDEYVRVGPVPDGEDSPPFYSDASLLALETEESVHELGGGLVFSTVDAWRQGRTGFPFDVWFGWRAAVAGAGGRTPKTSRATVGLRLYRGLWGGS
jgi:hypothetical protein